MISKLQFQFASCLFLELRRSFLFHQLVKPVAPILCLVGDIGSPYSKVTSEFIKYCNKNWDTILWVPGYHELAAKNGIHIMPIEDCFLKMKDICQSHSNVHLMYKNTWKSTSGHVFLGTPLWGTGHTRNIRFRIFSQYNNIYGVTLQAYQLAEMVEKNRIWLDGHIEEANELGEKVICLTYTSPILQGIPLEINTMKNQFDQLVRPPVMTWVVGDINDNIKFPYTKGFEFKQYPLFISNSLKDISSQTFTPSKHILA